MLKHLVFFAALSYTVALTGLCLIKIDTVPVPVKFSDKIVHCGAYFVLTLLWYLVGIYKFYLKSKKALWYAAIGAVVFGIVIEVLQGTLTTYRSADVYDIIANTLGVILAVLLVSVMQSWQIKKQ